MKRTRASIGILTMVAAVATLGAQNSTDQRIRRIENAGHRARAHVS